MFTQGTYKDPSSAKNYSDNNDVQFNQASAFINENGELVKGETVDIGSGDGKLTAHFSSTFHVPITGVDISEARVKFATDHFGSDKVKFKMGNAMTLSDALPKTQFETIISSNTLHHIPRNMMPTVFKQIHKLSKSNGVALLLIPGRSPELHDSIHETAKSECWKKYFADFDLAKVRTYETPQYYKMLSFKSGFYHCEVTAEIMTGGKAMDLNGMKNFLAGWLPHLAHLKSQPIKDKDKICDQFLSEIVRCYFKKLGKSLTDFVDPQITQNKVILYVSESSLFKKSVKGRENIPESKQGTALRSRL